MKLKVKFVKNASVLMFIIMMTIIIIGCANQEKNQGSITISITDSPDSVTAVLVNIQSVDVHYSGRDSLGWKDVEEKKSEADDSTDCINNGSWVSLNTVSGVYNLIDLQNGVEQLIATGEIDAGYVTQIRFILGDNNSIVMHGDTLALFIPSATNTGIKINFRNEIIPDSQLNVLVDFDLQKSVLVKEEGHVMFKPVLKVKSAAHS